MTDLSRASAPDDGGIPRRTLIAGAAWSIPVIATAATAPAAAASAALTLAFDKSTYSGAACSTITGAHVTVTTNGAPTAGISISVSLSNGYTFSSGSASATGLSDANGRYSLPTIQVPVTGGTAALTGTTAGANTSVSISGTPAGAGVFVYDSGSDSTFDNTANYGVPANAKPVGFDTWLTPTGDLYRASKKIASSVNAAAAEWKDDITGVLVSYATNAGVFVYDSGSDSTFDNTANYGVPANAKPVGFDTWLTPTGDLYRASKKIASSVNAAAAEWKDDITGVLVSYQAQAAIC